MLQSDLCYYSDAYIVVKGTITVEGAENRDKHNRNSVLKNNVPFICYISKINNTLIENVKYLDIVRPMYYLLKYSKNYARASSTLWNYYKDIPTDPVTNSEYFKYKTANDGKEKKLSFLFP